MKRRSITYLFLTIYVILPSVLFAANSTSQSCLKLTQTLVLNDTDKTKKNEVSLLQMYLKNTVNPSLKVTGKFDVNTKNSVKLFQKKNKTEQTGGVGKISSKIIEQQTCNSNDIKKDSLVVTSFSKSNLNYADLLKGSFSLNVKDNLLNSYLKLFPGGQFAYWKYTETPGKYDLFFGNNKVATESNKPDLYYSGGQVTYVINNTTNDTQTLVSGGKKIVTADKVGLLGNENIAKSLNLPTGKLSYFTYSASTKLVTVFYDNKEILKGGVGILSAELVGGKLAYLDIDPKSQTIIHYGDKEIIASTSTDKQVTSFVVLGDKIAYTFGNKSARQVGLIYDNANVPIEGRIEYFLQNIGGKLAYTTFNPKTDNATLFYDFKEVVTVKAANPDTFYIKSAYSLPPQFLNLKDKPAYFIYSSTTNTTSFFYESKEKKIKGNASDFQYLGDNLVYKKYDPSISSYIWYYDEKQLAGATKLHTVNGKILYVSNEKSIVYDGKEIITADALGAQKISDLYEDGTSTYFYTENKKININVFSIYKVEDFISLQNNIQKVPLNVNETVKENGNTGISPKKINTFPSKNASVLLTPGGIFVQSEYGKDNYQGMRLYSNGKKLAESSDYFNQRIVGGKLLYDITDDTHKIRRTVYNGKVMESTYNFNYGNRRDERVIYSFEDKSAKTISFFADGKMLFTVPSNVNVHNLTFIGDKVAYSTPSADLEYESLFYDGKKIDVSSGAYSITFVTDVGGKIAYVKYDKTTKKYTVVYNGEKKDFTDKIYDVSSVGSNIVYITENVSTKKRTIFYNGKPLATGDEFYEIVVIKDKLAFTVNETATQKSILYFDGKVVPTEGRVEKIKKINNSLVYVTYDATADSNVIVYNDKKIVVPGKVTDIEDVNGNLVYTWRGSGSSAPYFALGVNGKEILKTKNISNFTRDLNSNTSPVYFYSSDKDENIDIYEFR